MGKIQKQILYNVSLKEYSSFYIGKKAKNFIWTKSAEQLLETVRWAEKKKIPYMIFAGGTNIVFPDKNINLLVIRNWGGELKINKTELQADTGIPLTDVINASIFKGLQGLEKLSGIPGSIGGAVIGNAGAYGKSISDVVSSVKVWDGKQKRSLSKTECLFKYRHSIFKEKKYVLLKINLTLSTGNKDKLKKKSKAIIKIRNKKYDPSLKCPGSFFKNILVRDISNSILKKIDQTKIIEGKLPAGYLLEQIGAKNLRIGDIKVSDFHGNLIINLGKGTRKDVEILASILKKRVKKKFGIQLEEEVRFV